MSPRIKLLGPYLFENENGTPSEIMKWSKGCALLAYLIITRQAQSRELLADLLWDASSTAQSLQNLRKLLSRIRPWAPELLVTRKQVAYVAETAADIDLYRLTTSLALADYTTLDNALRLYTGDLLNDLFLEDAPRFNEWLSLERERFRLQVMAAYRQVCHTYADQKSWLKGIDAARRWLLLDTFDEEPLRYLMQFLAASGQVEVALSQYETSRQQLWTELAVEPEPETGQLAGRLAALKEESGQGIAWDVIVGAQPAWPEPDKLAEPGALPALSLMPYRRNEDFVGREDSLLHLAKILLPWPDIDESIARQVVAITGMGGLGKTQLTVEFCYRYGRYFPGGIFWISFADAENVAEEIAAVGSERGLGLYRGTEQLIMADRIGRVQRAWQKSVPRLLIFDNCEEESLLARWLPVTGGCRVLLTSRRADWPRELQVNECSLEALRATDSAQLLQQLAPELQAPEAAEIAAELGHLPLALHLAGGFLHRYRQISPVHYLAQLREFGLMHHPSLQGRGVTHSPTGHELNVSRTFNISLEQLDPRDETDAVAQLLLARAACFAPGEPIPQELLLVTLIEDETDISAMMLAEDGLRRLMMLGFLTGEGSETAVMHHLLARFTNDVMNDMPAAQTAVRQAIYQVIENKHLKMGALFSLPVAAVHLRYLTQTTSEPADEHVANMAYYLGVHLNHVADFVGSLSYLQQALAIYTNIYGTNHLETAKCLHSLGILHVRTGAYKEARIFYERTLAIREEVVGPNHRLTGISLANLGYLLSLQGDFQQARAYLERALVIGEQESGPNDPFLATFLNNLGVVFLNLGDIKSAKTYLEQAFIIREQLDPEHPYTAVSLQNLGLLSLETKMYADAQAYLEKSLVIREQVLGPNHPHTARSLNALGQLFLAQGAYEAAQPSLEQALVIQERVLMANHPEKALTFKNLGELHLALGAHDQAQSYFEQADRIFRESVVAGHPDWQHIQARLTALGK